MSIMNKWSHFIGGVLLVSGTTIGAGMLALPIATGMAGFYPSLFLFIFFWGYMTFTSFLILEVNLWMSRTNTNLITMAKHTLGNGGKWLSWIVYLFLLYALTTAYIAGSSSIFVGVIASYTGYVPPSWLGFLPVLAILGFFLFKGTRSADLLNRMLMMCLVIVYGCLVVYLAPHVSHDRFDHIEWASITSAISVVATSFGFHIIIPSLTTYMNKDIPLLRWSILIGSLIPLIVYIVWEYLTLGIIPLEGSFGIIEGYGNGADGATLVGSILNKATIPTLAMFFSFFAIITSFLGVSMSLSDFLADGLKIQKTNLGKLGLFCMILFPPLAFTLFDPRAFLTALEYAGAFGVIVLLCLLPALMVWRGRYYHHYYSSFRAPGGKLSLVITILISVIIIWIEIVNKLGLLK